MHELDCWGDSPNPVTGVSRQGPLAPNVQNVVWWRNPADCLSWADTDGLTAVYDAATGETHILTQLPALLLQNIGAAPRSALQLMENLSGEDPSSAKSGDIQKVVVALEFLHVAELIESSVD